MIFADASGESEPGVVKECEPGYGAWCVRGRILYIIHGLWSADELRCLSISVLEYAISLFAAMVFHALHPATSHLLEFSDNSGTEWSMRRETPSSALMQAVAAKRSIFLRDASIFSRVNRVTSADNAWADWLSRQRLSDVLSDAAALGLTVKTVPVSAWPDGTRDLS